MAVSATLRRLLRVLQLEEDQARGELERSVGELRRLEQARSRVVERERTGRRLVMASAGSGEILDRLAGVEETRVAERLGAVLQVRIAAAEKDVVARREAFLAKQVKRRQAETLIEEAEARDAAEASRRGQQAADEWFLSRKRREELAGGAGVPCCADVEPKSGTKKT